MQLVLDACVIFPTGRLAKRRNQAGMHHDQAASNCAKGKASASEGVLLLRCCRSVIMR